MLMKWEFDERGGRFMCRILKDETLTGRPRGHLPVGAGFGRPEGRTWPWLYYLRDASTRQ